MSDEALKTVWLFRCQLNLFFSFKWFHTSNLEIFFSSCISIWLVFYFTLLKSVVVFFFIVVQLPPDFQITKQIICDSLFLQDQLWHIFKTLVIILEHMQWLLLHLTIKKERQTGTQTCMPSVDAWSGKSSGESIYKLLGGPSVGHIEQTDSRAIILLIFIRTTPVLFLSNLFSLDRDRGVQDENSLVCLAKVFIHWAVAFAVAIEYIFWKKMKQWWV